MKRLPNSTLKEGDHVTVVKISKSDAYWSDRKYFIGRSGRIESIHERNWPWAFASIIFDKETDNGQLSGIFYSVLLKRA